MEEQKIDLDKVRQDEGKKGAYSHRGSHRKRKKRKILKRILLLLLLLLLAGIGACVYLFFSGQAKITQKGQASRPELKPVHTEEVQIDTEILDEDTIKYNGTKYKYNEDMINLLFIGVDTSGAVNNLSNTVANADSADTGIAGADTESKAGQADTIILAALDNKAKKVTLIPVNRDTFTDISIYDVYGKFVEKQKEQIALSYAYGDGQDKSAELTKEAVSNLFYGLPIQGYFAINTSAITVINDMIGGVELSLLDDFTFVDPSYAKGTTVRLQGSFAETYLRSRMGVGDGTNVSRMDRQQQYLTALASQTLGAVKKDLTLPVSIYQTVTDYMITDVSADEVSYLATQAVGYSLSGNFIRNISGESVAGDIYMEFHVDEKAFYELILDVFYEKVK